MKILVTAFDPFGENTMNASLEAINALPYKIADTYIIKQSIPTIFGKSLKCLHKTIDEVHPDIVICVGQATGRFGITPERIAINVMDACIPDNEGNQPNDIPIITDGPAAYFSTLPIKNMVTAIQLAGIPASVSNSAGTYVCNQLMYGLMHLIRTQYSNIKGGFIHVPCLPMQATTKKKVPSMALSDITRGLKIAIETIINTK